MPRGRTSEYAVWLACERTQVRPPHVKERWEDNTPFMQAMLLAYSQVRDYEEHEKLSGIVRL